MSNIARPSEYEAAIRSKERAREDKEELLNTVSDDRNTVVQHVKNNAEKNADVKLNKILENEWETTRQTYRDNGWQIMKFRDIIRLRGKKWYFR